MASYQERPYSSGSSPTRRPRSSPSKGKRSTTTTTTTRTHTTTGAATFATAPRFPSKQYARGADSLVVRTSVHGRAPTRFSVRGGGGGGASVGHSTARSTRTAGGSHRAGATASLVRGGQESFATGEIEAEFIRNLQQQVYYLDLEVNFLREELTATARKTEERLQAQNVEDMLEMRREHAAQTARLRARIGDLEGELGEQHADAEEQRRSQADVHAELAERKRVLVEESVTLQRQVQELERENGLALAELRRSREEGSNSAKTLAGADRDNRLLRSQLDEQAGVVDQLTDELGEARTQLVHLRTEGEALQHRLQSQDAAALPELRTLKNENLDLRARVTHADAALDAERQHRQRQAADLDALVQENALLGAQLRDANRALDAERARAADAEASEKRHLQELFEGREEAKHLRRENDRLRQELGSTADRFERSVAEAADQQVQISELDTEAMELRRQLGALREVRSTESLELNAATRDRTLLTDHVQRLEGIAEEAGALQHRNRTLEQEGAELREQVALYERMSHIRWSDLEDMAGAVKDFTHRMDESRRSGLSFTSR